MHASGDDYRIDNADAPHKCFGVISKACIPVTSRPSGAWKSWWEREDNNVKVAEKKVTLIQNFIKMSALY